MVARDESPVKLLAHLSGKVSSEESPYALRD